MKKRLLLISSNSSSRGGGERYLVYLTQALHILDFEVHILLSAADYMDNWALELAAEGALVHRRNLLGLRSRRLRFVEAILDQRQQQIVTQVCLEVSPDAVLVNQQYDEDGLDYLAGALAANTAPVGGIMHMPMSAQKNKRPLGQLRGQLVQQWYKKHPYSLILVSKGSQQEFENYYDHPRPTQVVNHGCAFQPCSRRPYLPDEWDSRSPVIGFSGQLVAQKNLHLLVDSWLWTRQQGANSRLVLVGDGPERQALEAKLKENAPQNTWYITGWQKSPEAYLRYLDIFAMTSHFEGLPLALIEAVGRGLPAVVTDFNGAIDIAQRAAWVRVAEKSTPESVGRMLIEIFNQLPLLKQQAADEQKRFQDYFSLRRMALETIAALGIIYNNNDANYCPVH